GVLGVDAGQAVQEVLRGERDVDVLAGEADAHALVGAGGVAGGGADADLVGGEREPDGGAALGDERRPLERLHERGDVDLDDGRPGAGEPGPVVDVLVVQQAAGHAAAAAGDADEGLGAAAEVDRHVLAAPDGLGGVGEGPGGDDDARGEAGVGGGPRQLARGDAVPVGAGQPHRVALDVDADAGEHREGVVAPGCGCDLGDGGGEQVARDGSG